MAVIAVDFDGTCVTHEFPKVGKDIGAQKVLKKLVEKGHQLILFTMRSNVSESNGFSIEVPEILNGNFLDDAVNWFKKNGIPLYGINVNPEQISWTKSPKAYAQLYIDDAALGCPLIFNTELSRNYFVDWEEIEILLENKNIL
jgi:hypothetical protein